MKKTLLFYSIFFFCFLILQRASGFIVKILLANQISPYDYGLITMVAISLPGMLQLITNFNFYQILSHSKEGKKYFGFSVITGIALVVIISILLFLFNKEFFAYLNMPEDKSEFFLIMIIITLFTQSIIVDFQGLFTGLRFYARPAILMAIPSLIRLAAVAVLMVLNVYSFEIIILIFTLSNAAPFVYLLISKKHLKHIPSIRSIEIPSKTVFLFGLSVFFISQIPSIIQYSTRIIVSHELGIVWQGYYDVSVTIAGLILFALGAMSFVAIPEATFSANDSLYKKGGLSDITRVFFCLVILFSLIIFFFSDFVVVTLFSEDYLVSGQNLPVLTIGFLFLFVQFFLASIMLSTTSEARGFLPLIIGGLILLALNYFLTGMLIDTLRGMGYGNGFAGAYISTSFTLIIWTLFTLVISKDRSPVMILFKNGNKLVLSIAITSALILCLHPAPLIGIISIITVFSLLVFLSGYLDLQMFREIVLNK
jgi:O-antigen/teichoic acid export membrane protein